MLLSSSGEVFNFLIKFTTQIFPDGAQQMVSLFCFKAQTWLVRFCHLLGRCILLWHVNQELNSDNWARIVWRSEEGIALATLPSFFSWWKTITPPYYYEEQGQIYLYYPGILLWIWFFPLSCAFLKLLQIKFSDSGKLTMRAQGS